MRAISKVRCAVGIAVLYLLLIFYLGSISRPLVTVSVRAGDKWGHALAFGLMQWTHHTAYRFLFPRRADFDLRLAAIATTSLAGALLEFWQFLTPNRSPELLDWVADTVGAVLFSCVFPRDFVEAVLPRESTWSAHQESRASTEDR